MQVSLQSMKLIYLGITGDRMTSLQR